MASDPALPVRLPSAMEFRVLLKKDLEELAVKWELVMPGTLGKPEMQEFLKKHMDLPAHWGEIALREKRQHEAEREERLRKEHWAKVEAENAQREKEREEKEREREERRQLRAHELRVEQIKNGVPVGHPGFDLKYAEHSVPRFEEEAVDVFFSAFENVASDLDWPQEKWALLVQRALVGKAQQAYSSLEGASARDYGKLKEAVLAAYGSVPDEYRKKFRVYRRGDGESHMEVCQQQGIRMNRWLASIKAVSAEEVKEAFHLEQFRNTLHTDLEVYVAERAPKTAKEAAEMADAWEVIHYGRTGRGRGELSRTPEGNVGYYNGDGERRGQQAKKGAGSSRNQRSGNGERSQGPREWKNRSPQPEIRCYGCKKLGHPISKCPDLGRREERERAVCLVAIQTQSSGTGPVGDEPGLDRPVGGDPLCSLPVTPGAIAEWEGGPEVKIRVLRDTGAEQSLLQVGWLSLPPPAGRQPQCVAVNLRGGDRPFSPERGFPTFRTGVGYGDGGNGGHAAEEAGGNGGSPGARERPGRYRVEQGTHSPPGGTPSCGH